MKIVKYVLCIVFLVALAGGGYRLYKLSTQPVYANVLPRDVTILTSQTVWPHIEDLPDSAVQNQLNQYFQQELDRFTGSVEGSGASVQVDYRVGFNKNNILSLTVTEFVSPPRAAHPMTYLKAFTVNLKTGRLYQFSELFSPDSDYRSRINAIIHKQINEKQITFITPYDGIKESGQEFYLTPAALVVYYQLYEYTPYVYGFLKFPIPLADIADLLMPEVRQAVP
ncbi:MAG TPA: DUF3298 domain-containing protein [Methylomusa anaerophila]|uniref:DUF3298 domain-containing protein n=1 Tax=Methylomusa anaerophila TaxID=1930071 RepID=A0A348AK53_9FIRM|nr:DUF3298 and DUF4163 domain-containing protein [Methylomusa anaerophila]BBB91451.1 hypothetical protein MAMMFC1_02135 [Methylomusa anaerophila]HML89961.1 DUF3298 domain-containing protein [Methylomusa anaerophila]